MQGLPQNERLANEVFLILETVTGRLISRQKLLQMKKGILLCQLINANLIQSVLIPVGRGEFKMFTDYPGCIKYS